MLQLCFCYHLIHYKSLFHKPLHKPLQTDRQTDRPTDRQTTTLLELLRAAKNVTHYCHYYHYCHNCHYCHYCHQYHYCLNSPMSQLCFCYHLIHYKSLFHKPLHKPLPTDRPTDQQLDFQSCSGQLKTCVFIGEKVGGSDEKYQRLCCIFEGATTKSWKNGRVLTQKKLGGATLGLCHIVNNLTLRKFRGGDFSRTPCNTQNKIS